ncbi:Deleted in malignant brain tumors 1 protein [Stylophora pistillata]|uniref:Deleted in malignant brain tumors 1 protein n=2 Tax=Stylophora pistillata TaxID=50429 RepID=A0A2B4SH21_STYPI|nr:Deleted in malignant brain tumors 1 protein [Stylophora pistillata]
MPIPEFRPIGCFVDSGLKPRPIPKLIANFRGKIDWHNLNKTVAECARRVNLKGFHYFGVQFYGECWSGDNVELTYNKQGTSKNCFQGVGRRRANFVYGFVEKEMSARLVNGPSSKSGRVEVFYRGSWGTVCSKEWDMRDAEVVCRMVGYSGALRAYRDGRYGSGKSRVRLGDVQCKGNEENLAFCSHKDYSNCTQSEIAAVKCKSASASAQIQPRISYRLVGGNSRSEGRVEVYYARQWGTICDKGWDLTDAGILCRMLAYTGARATPKYGQGSGRIWLSDVKCNGTEDSIFRCKNAGWGNVDNCDHSNDAGAECYHD